MNKTARVLLVSLLLAGTGTFLASCETDQDIDISKIGMESDPPEVLYNQGPVSYTHLPSPRD